MFQLGFATEGELLKLKGPALVKLGRGLPQQDTAFTKDFSIKRQSIMCSVNGGLARVAYLVKALCQVSCCRAGS